MEWQQTPYTFPLVITGVITFASAAYTFRQRHVPGAYHMFAMLLAVTTWVLLYAVELNAVNLADKLFWVKIQYIGIVYVPVSYALFVLKYVGEFQRIKKPKLFTAALFIIPGITLLLNWTNNQHQLIYRTTSLTFEQNLSYLVVEHGIGFWVYIGYIYLLLLSSSIILLRKIIATPEQYRGQIVLIILGSLFPWLANALYITKNNPFPYLNLTPFAFAAMALCFVWALFLYSFLDIAPLARGIVIEKLVEGVIVIDGQNRIIDMNDTAVALLQKNKKEVLGKPPAFDTPEWQSLKPLFEKQQSTQMELVINHTYYEASLILLESVNSHAYGRLITLHNITQQKNSERLMQRAKETAEAADQAKTNFLTNMSHEIRTPLNAIVGMAEMLRQTNLNPNQQEMLETVAQSSQDLMLLINNILDFSRLEAGTLTLNQQSFDLIDCIEASLENLTQTAKEKQLSLSYQIAPETPTSLVGDPVRLRQILVNLVENSIKFTQEGQITVTINHTSQENTAQLHFIVQDTGIGIAPKQIEALFSPFRQIDSSMTRTHGGNGLGLAICKQLVALMGGDIYLHSTIGQGTAVHFSAHFSLATKDDPPAISLRHHKTGLANKRLLIITKEAGQRRQITKEARVAGLEVYAAGSSQEANYWIEHSQPFDAVLLDTAVWQEDPAVIPLLRHRETNLPLPLILLTPAGTETAQLASSSTFAGFLSLPVVSSKLYDTLLNVLAAGASVPASHNFGESMASRFPLRILLAEDNKLNQRIIKKMLNKLGYQVDLANNGQTAVQMASQTSYDLILMDIQMPVMDGVEATRRILAQYTTGKRPYLIAVTAHALEGDREYYLSLGINNYLSKPVKLNQLVEALYQSLSPQKQPSSPPPSSPIATLSTHPIDLAELALLVGGDTTEFLEMMAPIFLEDTPKLLHTLANAIQNNDSTGMVHAAHTLKGSSASLAMKTLAEHSRELEQMAKAADFTEAPRLFQEIQAEYGRVEAALANMVETAV